MKVMKFSFLPSRSFLSQSKRLKDIDLRALGFSALASVFEWYDFALFGYFSSTIGQVFFSSKDPFSQHLSVFAVFASGFFMRPVGALCFGHLGDRFGRKPALIGSVTLMALATFFLGLCPGYASWGWASTLSVILIRFIQGFAIGGNYGCSFLLIIERSAPSAKGFMGSLPMCGTLGGLALGSLVAMLTKTLDVEYAWRIPFLLGGGAAWIAYWAHTKVEEEAPSPQDKKEVASLRPYVSLILAAICIILMDAVGIYTLFVYLTTYATTSLKLPEGKIFMLNSLMMTLLVAAIPFFGALGDKVTPKKILQGCAWVFLLFGPLLFSALVIHPSLMRVALLQGVFAVTLGAVYGALPLAITQAFDRRVRYRASALSFNLSVGLFGGSTPFLLTKIIQDTGSLFVPAFFLGIVGLISLLGTHFLTQHHQQ